MKKTPLHVAVKWWRAEAVKLLINKGADVNALYPDGDSPLHKAVERELDLTEPLLSSKEININHQGKNGDSPLHRAIKKSRSDVVKALLKVKGIKLDLRDNEGNTPLQTAIEGRCSREIIKLFVNAGANINVKDNKGKTPLHIAVEKLGIDKRTKLLINAGADVNIKDNTGKTPLDIAVQKRLSGETMELLIKHTLPQNPNIKPSGLQEEDLAYWKKCEDEISDMKQYELGDGVLLFDILTTNDKRKLASHMSNENIVEAFRSNRNAIKKRFPIYFDQIGKQRRKGLDELERKCAVDEVVYCYLRNRQERDLNIEKCKQDISEKDEGEEEEVRMLELNEYELRDILKYVVDTDLLKNIVPRSKLSTTNVEAEKRQREK